MWELERVSSPATPFSPEVGGEERVTQEKLQFPYIVSQINKSPKSMTSSHFPPFDIFLVVSNMKQPELILDLGGSAQNK